MTKTLAVDEGRPEAWPAIVTTPWVPGNGFDAEAVWLRIEGWIAYRWGERPCTFVVEGGGGCWRAPLAPFAVETSEAWNGSAWEAVALDPHPLGGVSLGAASAYRFTGTLGSADEPPAAVREAFLRLADHFHAIRKHTPMLGAWRHRQTDREGASIAIDRAPNWTARVLANSGAADLLRPYRDLGGAAWA